MVCQTLTKRQIKSAERRAFMEKYAPVMSREEFTEAYNKEFGTKYTVTYLRSLVYKAGILKNERFLFNEEHDKFLIENGPHITCSEMLELFEKTFNYKPQKASIYQRYKRLNIQPKLERTKFTQKEVDFLREYGSNLYFGELYNLFIERYRYYTKDAFRYQCDKYDIKYAHGFTLVNDRVKTRYREIGYELVRKVPSGKLYNFVKCAHGIKDNYVRKDKLIYEASYGELPSTHTIIHLDGNTLNDDIDNLFAVDRRVISTFTRLGLKITDNPEINLSIINTGQLQFEISQAIKKRL